MDNLVNSYVVLKKSLSRQRQSLSPFTADCGVAWYLMPVNTPNYLKNRTRHVSITFGKPMPNTSTAEEVKQAVQALSMSTWDDYVRSLPTIPTLWLARAKRMGNECATADSSGLSLSHHELISATMLLAKKLKKIAPVAQQQNIGLLLPPSVAGTIANLASWMNGHTVVNLNYTTSEESFQYAVNLAKVKTIITAKAFITKLEAKAWACLKQKQKSFILKI